MLNTAESHDYKYYIQTTSMYQASFLDDLFKSKYQTKFIKIRKYAILNINMSSFKTPALFPLHYPDMQIHQLWTNFPDIILAFDVRTCIRILINR